MATVRSPHKGGFFIGVSCPGCGGELELQGDFHLVVCPHCASVLRLIMPEAPPAFLVAPRKPITDVRFAVDRHCRDNNLPLTGAGLQIKRLLYPYWKIDAVMLKVRTVTYEVEPETEDEYADQEPQERTRTDITLLPDVATLPAGPRSEIIPYSLGLRTDYLRLRPFSRETLPDDFDILPLTTPWDEAATRARNTVGTMARIDGGKSGDNSTRLFHPVGSIVYFPYFLAESTDSHGLRQFAVDAVTGRVANECRIVETETPVVSEESLAVSIGQIAVALHRCSNCGVDLPESPSFVYACHNCQRVEFLESSPLLNRGIQAVAIDKAKEHNWYPFWAFHLSESSAAGVHSVMGGIYPSRELVIPAFAIRNFESLYRLSRRVTTAASQLSLSELDRLETIHEPVVVGLNQALTLAEVIIQRDLSERRVRAASADLSIAPVDARLWYLPFRAESYFWVDSLLGAITFERGALGVAGARPSALPAHSRR
jgi:hypothetical protein